MRDYLYIWNCPEKSFFVASGIHFADIVPHLAKQSGVILLRHTYGDASSDEKTRLDYVSASEIQKLATDNIYDYGDFCWIDVNRRSFPLVGKAEVAELLYFAHMGVPLKGHCFQSLANRYACYSHDDGWYLKLYYRSWKDARQIIASNLSAKLKRHAITQVLKSLSSSKKAFWITKGNVNSCKRTEDIDSIQQKFGKRG